MTLPAPAISPYVPFYATLQPYITVAEFLAQPTGVDTSQLIPGGTTEQNAAALTTLIASASNYADALCFQVLAATTDLQSGEYRVWRDGTIRVPVDNSPLIEVTNVAVGYRPGDLAAMTDLSRLWIEKKVVRIPITNLADQVFAQVTYVNGYTNTALAASADVGASSIELDSALGVFPGMPLTIYDGQSTEPVIVGAAYVPGATVVPLAAPLAFAHTAGVAVSALPRAIKQAVIALTAHLIKTRGAESLSMQGVSGGPAKTDKQSPGSSEEYDLAVDLLRPFARVR